MINTDIIENLSAKELEQLRALTDPLRLKLHTNFREARTVSEVAAIVGVERTSLYHHMQVLLKAGLIEEVETRKVRHLTESVYKKTSDRVSYTRSNHKDPGSHELYSEGIMAMSREAYDVCQRSLSRETHVRAASRRIMLKFKQEDIDIVPKQVAVLMHEFIDKVKELDYEDGDVEYSLIVTHFEMP